MKNFYLLKPRYTSILITLLIALQISACSTEENLTAAITDNINPGINDANTDTNSAAVISGIDTGSVIEDVDPDGDNLLETSGKLNIVDNGAGEAAFIAETVNGNYGSLTIDLDGNWNYAASNSQPVIQNLAGNATLTDNLTVNSIDGTSHTIVITIIGVTDSANNTNSPAVITGVNSGSVTEDVDPDNDNLLEVGGKLNITDNDAGEAVFIATTINGNYGGLTIDAAGNWAYAANNSQAVIQNLATGATLSDSLTVSSLDGTTHVVTITIFGMDEINTTANIGLSWVAPAQREDNTPIALSEIANYKIYYGSIQGQYPNSVTINDGTAVSYTFQSFTSGTYYFVVTTIDTQGRESLFSTEVMITI